MILKIKTPLTARQRLFEAFFIMCCCAALFILLALLSFNVKDNSWNVANSYATVYNYAGSIGALVADCLFSSLGYVAYAFPLVFLISIWIVCRHYLLFTDINLPIASLRCIGGVVSLLSLCALLSMNTEPFYFYSGGGFIGHITYSSLIPYFNWIGTSLLLCSFFVSGLILLSGIRLVQFVEWTGSLVIKAYHFIAQYVYAWYQNTVLNKRNDEDHRLVAEEKEEKVNFSAEESVKKSSLFSSFRIKKPLFSKVSKTKKASYEESLLCRDQELSFDTVGVESAAQEVIELNTQKLAEPSHLDDMDLECNTEHSEPQINTAPMEQVSESDTVTSAPTQEEALCVEGESTPASEPDLFAEDIQDSSMMSPNLKSKNFGLPELDLLDKVKASSQSMSKDELAQLAELVEKKLEDFNIKADVVNVCPGPVITRFELDLAPGVKVSKITSLSKDLARALSAMSVRVVEVIPGKSFIGLELPNLHREVVLLSQVLDCSSFLEHKSHLAMVLGADIAGEPVVADLAKMPHLLVAGTTGSGKSVGVNVMILSLLYKSTPDDVRLIMIDPKMLELSVYEGIPHLLCEVVTDMKQASNALRWCVGEMERRYQLMSALGVRNLEGYNSKIADAKEKGEPILDPLWDITQSSELHPPVLDKLPSIVVVIDEFADMMMIVGKKVEELIARIAQKARAAGIHLILATQRPSVDVITGLIKANVPTRIAFQVSSKIDSRTILDQQGAETLLGMGDMLYLPSGTGTPTRVHGAFVADHEVHRVVTDWKQRAEPEYIDSILAGTAESGEAVLLPGEAADTESELDALYDEAVAFVTETRRGSISSVQRKFKIGYNRAARIIEQMESQGIVSSPMSNGNREVLAPEPVKV